MKIRSHFEDWLSLEKEYLATENKRMELLDRLGVTQATNDNAAHAMAKVQSMIDHHNERLLNIDRRITGVTGIPQTIGSTLIGHPVNDNFASLEPG